MHMLLLLIRYVILFLLTFKNMIPRSLLYSYTNKNSLRPQPRPIQVPHVQLFVAPWYILNRNGPTTLTILSFLAAAYEENALSHIYLPYDKRYVAKDLLCVTLRAVHHKMCPLNPNWFGNY